MTQSDIKRFLPICSENEAISANNGAISDDLRQALKNIATLSEDYEAMAKPMKSSKP